MLLQASVDGRIQDLEEEVADLKTEVRRLRRLVNELKQNLEESESRSESRDTSYTPIGEWSATRSPTPGVALPGPFSPQDRRGSQLQSVPEANYCSGSFFRTLPSLLA
jgi:TolA-binding protein